MPKWHIVGIHMSPLKFIFCCFTEDPPAGGTDVDLQLLEASKAGDMEVVKVIHRFVLVIGCFSSDANGSKLIHVFIISG